MSLVMTMPSCLPSHFCFPASVLSVFTFPFLKLIQLTSCFAPTIEKCVYCPIVLKSNMVTCSFPGEPMGRPRCAVSLEMGWASLNKARLGWSESCSVMSDSLWPQGLYSPWNSPGQNTGVGSFFLFQGISQPRDLTRVSCIAGRFFTSWATRVAQARMVVSNNTGVCSQKIKC